MSGFCEFCQVWHSGSCCHPGRAILAFQEAEIRRLRDTLLGHGFVRCNSLVCNCGGWHMVRGLKERMDELEEDLADAGHPLCNDNEHLVRKALQALVKERDAFREMNEKLKTELEDSYSADNEIQEIARKVETENERLHAEITRLREANEKLEALLERIERHPHCEDGRCAFIKEIPSLHPIFERGCMEGHRCAAKIAAERHKKCPNS